MIRFQTLSGFVLAALLLLPGATATAASPTLVIKNSVENPAATRVVVYEDTESEDFTLFVAELQNTSSEDIHIQDLVIDTTISGSVKTDDVIEYAEISIDGDIIQSTEIETKNDGNLYFDNVDFYLDAGESEELELTVSFRETDGNYAPGTTVRFDIAPADITAHDEDDDELPGSAVSGSAKSALHTLSLSGIWIEPVSTSESYSADKTQGIFTIKFEVSVDGQDLFIPKTLTASTTSGPVYAIESKTPFAGTKNAVLYSTGDTSGNFFVVEDGDAEVFTLTVLIDPVYSDSYKVRLKELRFADAPTMTPNDSVKLTGPDFVTKALRITEAGSTFKGTYRGYMNGKLFIQTKNITEAMAYDNCMVNVRNNPGAAIRCIWNDREIFSNVKAVISGTVKVDNPYTTDNPTVKGTAKNTTRIGLMVSGGKYMDRYHVNQAVPVSKNGTWSYKIPTDLPDGDYDVTLHAPDVDPGPPLARAVMVVRTVAQPITCSATADRTNIKAGESVRVTWSSMGANYVLFLGEKGETSGTMTLNPETTKTYTFSFRNETTTKDCSVTIAVAEPEPAKGTYVGYLNNTMFIKTASITEADALANCKANASSNPSSSIRCTWNGKEIYRTEEPLVLPGETTKINEPLVLPSSTGTKSSTQEQTMLSASVAAGYEAIKLQLESILRSLRALR